VTREEIIEHMKVMGQNAARMDEVMMYVMTRKDCEVVMAAAELLEAVKPVLMDDDDWMCGNCAESLVGYTTLDAGGIVTYRFEYCPKCGRPVKWNE
jgi:hypothetical protein